MLLKEIESQVLRAPIGGRRALPSRDEIWLKLGMGVNMSHQMIFELLAAPYPAELSEAVNAKLAAGWQLFGHPFAHNDEFFQAVVGKVAADKNPSNTPGDGTAENNSG